jgi:predicted N-acetyltransferase YhbS
VLGSQVEIRRINNDERLTTALPLQVYAFDRSPKSASELAKFRDHLPYSEGNVTLVAEEGGVAEAVASAIPMRQNVRGSIHPMAGVAGVATNPLARRRGHVRALMTDVLGQMRDTGHVLSALYPFRPSFYQRFGYIGLPTPRTVSFTPADLGRLLRADLPGEVTWQRINEGYDGYHALFQRLLAVRHGFATFPDYLAVRIRDLDERWLATARVDGEVIGAVTYRITQHAGEMAADHLLSTGPVARALLLQFIARHVDQVVKVTATVAPDELPELWSTDLDTVTEAKAAFPSHAPMARVLSLDALAGMAVGPGRVRVEVPDDPFVAGSYLLDGTAGALEVSRAAATGPVPTATLTAAGLSALVYGVLDPVEVAIRGLGAVPDDAAAELRTMWSRQIPYLTVGF